MCSLRPSTWTPPFRTAGCSTSFYRMVLSTPHSYLFNLLNSTLLMWLYHIIYENYFCFCSGILDSSAGSGSLCEARLSLNHSLNLSRSGPRASIGARRRRPPHRAAFVIDARSSRILSCNEHALALLSSGDLREEIIGQPLSHLLRLEREEAPAEALVDSGISSYKQLRGKLVRSQYLMTRYTNE